MEYPRQPGSRRSVQNSLLASCIQLEHHAATQTAREVAVEVAARPRQATEITY